jgi:hypothetical protein
VYLGVPASPRQYSGAWLIEIDERNKCTVGSPFLHSTSYIKQDATQQQYVEEQLFHKRLEHHARQKINTDDSLYDISNGTTAQPIATAPQQDTKDTDAAEAVRAALRKVLSERQSAQQQLNDRLQLDAQRAADTMRTDDDEHDDDATLAAPDLDDGQAQQQAADAKAAPRLQDDGVAAMPTAPLLPRRSARLQARHDRAEMERRTQSAPAHAQAKAQFIRSMQAELEPRARQRLRKAMKVIVEEAVDDVAQSRTTAPMSRTRRKNLCRNQLARMMKTYAKQATLKTAQHETSKSTHDMTMMRRFEDPTSHKKAMAGPHATQWRLAEEQEIAQMRRLNIWEEVEAAEMLTLDPQAVLHTIWQYKTKYDDDNYVSRRKARLCIDGSKQRQGVNFQETFAPTANIVSTRLVALMAAQQYDKGVRLWSLDITAAFLNAPLKETVYMRGPSNIPSMKNKVFRLLRAVYGLKQAAHAWYVLLSGILGKLGWVKSQKDSCLFVKQNGDHESALAIHVDDMKIATTKKEFEKLCRALQEDHNLGVSSCLANEHIGVQIEQSAASIFLHQTAYTTNLLLEHNMLGSKPASKPGISGLDMLPDDSPFLDKARKQSYGRLVGSLQWLAIMTRVDIQFTVNFLSRFVMHPQECHFDAARHLLRYLNGTRGLGLKYACKQSGAAAHVLSKHAFVDASHASIKMLRDAPKSKSVSGYMLFVGDALIKWASKVQQSNLDARRYAAEPHSTDGDEDMVIDAVSSAGAEYLALSACCQDISYVTQTLKEFALFRDSAKTPWTVHEDNQSTIKVAENQHAGSKLSRHFAVRHNIIRHMLDHKMIELQYVTSQNQLADMLTKAHVPNMIKHREQMLSDS